jgi:hypothetical protein
MRIHPFIASLLRYSASRTPMGAILVGAYTIFASRRRKKRLAAAPHVARRTFAEAVEDGWEIVPAAV